MKPSPLSCLALLLALAAGPAAAQVASPSSEGPDFGKWETSVLGEAGKEVVRAATWSASNKTLLSYDFYVDDCRGVSFSMAWIRAQPADHDLYLNHVATTLQVDGHPAIPFLSTYQVAKGEIASVLTLAEIDDFTAAIEQMEQGRTVRMRVPWDVETRANDILEDYPLDGFAAALAWARKTCWDIAGHRPGKGQPLP
ncbi:hypothetical protein [Achromobacter aloeverae]